MKQQVTVTNKATTVDQIEAMARDVQVLDSYLGQVFLLMKYIEDRKSTLAQALYSTSVVPSERAKQLLKQLDELENSANTLKSSWSVDKGHLLTNDYIKEV